MLYLLLPSSTWLVGGGAAMLLVSMVVISIMYFKDLSAPVNLLDMSNPSLTPYTYLLNRFKWIDLFGFGTALTVCASQ